MTQKQAPRHLQAATRRWWAAVVRDYELDSHHLRLLTLCCESWDRCQQAREILAEYGLTFDDDGKPRTHPAVAIERDAKLSFVRILRELDLDVNSPADAARPPLLQSNRGR